MFSWCVQELICLRAIRDVNVPKFLQDDLKLFSGIVSDLFPRIEEEPIDYGSLEEAIRKTCSQRNLKDVDGKKISRSKCDIYTLPNVLEIKVLEDDENSDYC